MIGNDAAERLVLPRWRSLPPPELGLIVAVVALLIMRMQRHEQMLAEKRSLLTSRIAILSEQKIAKLTDMVDELRRANRHQTSAATSKLPRWRNPLIRLRQWS